MSEAYVPEISPVQSDYYLACHYFPGWNVHENGYSAFSDIVDFPERKPLIGFYDESDPEVADWNVKWALEHGVKCFIYCWYRKFENLGQPVTNDRLALNHAITALKKSRYGKRMDYAIMWETDNAAAVADERDFLENLVPFWCKEYFCDENYLKINGKPALFVYNLPNRIIEQFGGIHKLKEVFDKAEEKAKTFGLEGIHFMEEYRGTDPEKIKQFKESGYRNIFSYCWHVPGKPSQETVLETQISDMKKQIAVDPYYPLLTCSQAWDPYPWWRHTPENLKTISQWKLTPENWKKLLSRVKDLADNLPEEALGRKLILLDNWNEWCEGHYISPHESGKFEYLKAVREVFTKSDNTPDYRLPKDLGLGPYDKNIDLNAERIWYSF